MKPKKTMLIMYVKITGWFKGDLPLLITDSVYAEIFSPSAGEILPPQPPPPIATPPPPFVNPPTVPISTLMNCGTPNSASNQESIPGERHSVLFCFSPSVSPWFSCAWWGNLSNWDSSKSRCSVVFGSCRSPVGTQIN